MSRDSHRQRRLLIPGLAAVGLLFFALPLLGLLRKASWSTLIADLTLPESLSALRLSVGCSLSATALAVIFGFPLAWVLAQGRGWGTAFLRGLILLPLVLPPVVGGIALLTAFSRTGIIGESLYNLFGVQLTFNTWGVVLAETFVALPFFVITVEAGLRSMDRQLEDVARTLGAGQSETLRRVTLPLVAPSIIAGTVLAWARALGEFGATVTFAGNIIGRTQTLPLAIYAQLDSNPNAAIALSLVLLLVSLTVLILLRDKWLQSI
ncbi:MAG: ABC transporter permease [Microthrixaceae bacterium]